MFRQCYSPHEPASFKRAYDLVARAMHYQGREPQILRAWHRAHATLRRTHLDHLILVRAASEGHVPEYLTARNTSHPSQVDPPWRMIETVFYGDAIHWGDKRTVLEAWSRDHAVLAVKRRHDFLRAAIHLGHLYVGFAAVVGIATGALSPSDL